MLSSIVRRATRSTRHFYSSAVARANDDAWQRNALSGESRKYNENFNKIFGVDNMNRPKSENDASTAVESMHKVPARDEALEARAREAKAAKQFGTAIAAKKETDAPTMNLEEWEARAALEAARAGQLFGTQAPPAKKEDLNAPARRYERLLKEEKSLRGEAEKIASRLQDVEGQLSELEQLVEDELVAGMSLRKEER